MDPLLRRGLASAALERLQHRPTTAPEPPTWSAGAAAADEEWWPTDRGFPIVVDDQIPADHLGFAHGGRRAGKQRMIESYVAKMARVERVAVETACARALATGRGVRIVREPMTDLRMTDTSASARSALTIEVTSEVPAGTIAYYANGRDQ